MMSSFFSLIPAPCLLCGCATSGKTVCSVCVASFKQLEDACFGCAKLLADRVSSVYCQECLFSPKPYQHLWAAYYYSAPLTDLIQAMKFNRRLDIAHVLGQLLVTHLEEKLSTHWMLPQAIIPVPLSSRRIRQRGYNQVVEFLRPVIKRLPIKLEKNLCRRKKDTKPQSSLAKSQRINNMKNAFELSNACHYKHVAIVDDVVTTGNTIKQLSMLLQSEGVEWIEVWAIARA